MLPATFTLVDEFYVFDSTTTPTSSTFAATPLGSPTKLPIAWHRQEGQGPRLLHRARPRGRGVVRPEDPRRPRHPGILWALKRGP
jgi:hypothetical protein